MHGVERSASTSSMEANNLRKLLAAAEARVVIAAQDIMELRRDMLKSDWD